VVMRTQRGQANVEYLVVCGILLLALLGSQGAEGKGPLAGLMGAIKQGYQGYVYAVAQPELPARFKK